YIQASRALMIASIVLGTFGLVGSLIGIQCSKAGGENYVLKGRIAGTSGVFFILQDCRCFDFSFIWSEEANLLAIKSCSFRLEQLSNLCFGSGTLELLLSVPPGGLWDRDRKYTVGTVPRSVRTGPAVLNETKQQFEPKLSREIRLFRCPGVSGPRHGVVSAGRRSQRAAVLPVSALCPLGHPAGR
ncbi:hypothetical protein GOODEAATRI_009257, partial [Goodea atripinnis]